MTVHKRTLKDGFEVKDPNQAITDEELSASIITALNNSCHPEHHPVLDYEHIAVMQHVELCHDWLITGALIDLVRAKGYQVNVAPNSTLREMNIGLLQVLGKL